MSAPRRATFRSAMQVSADRITGMRDAELSLLMGKLLRHQAYKCGSPPNEIFVNTEADASDGGCDGWSGTPTIEDLWLGTANTCWQFKSGRNGQPAKLAGEVAKRIPRETLINGGRFVVIASGCTSGTSGERARRKVLVDEANANSIPSGRIEVIGSERLANWCNENPAIAAHWSGRPEGLWTLDDWSRSPEHQVAWQATEGARSQLEKYQSDLDFVSGGIGIQHLHIKGLPGVGKTRLALELCRGATWREAVIYARQAIEVPLSDLIHGAASEPDVQLVVVVDEAQPDQLRPLRDLLDKAEGRVRLITIGHSTTPDPVRIPALPVEPLDDRLMQEVVSGWHSEMPREHVDFVVRFAAGYVRLARLAAQAVMQQPRMDVRGLLNREEIRTFLDQMLGPTEARHALYVVAALTSVGWTEDKAEEGIAIANHFKLDWNQVRATVEQYQRRLGIAPQGGRYRYISPTPLGIHLAVEAWTTWPDLMKSLPDVLPSEEAKEAYYERLQSIASNPQARAFAKGELGFFFRLDDFIEESIAKRWSALSSAEPEQAAKAILNALHGTSNQERMRIEGGARRQVVWTLVRLAWRSAAFHDSVKSLALLAEAENETWANNATGEFLAKYQISLSGTALPYVERMNVLDELLAEQQPMLTRLVVKALAQVGKQLLSRTIDRPATDELPELEWMPRTAQQRDESVEAAITRLCTVARLRAVGIESELVSAANAISKMLRNSGTRGLVSAYFEAVLESYPEMREPLRRIINHIVVNEQKHWKQISAADLEELKKLHTRFEGKSLSARLLQYVGARSWDLETLPDLTPLAAELLQSPKDLADNWQWLTSGEASDAFRLGELLAEIDKKGDIASTLPTLPTDGQDFRILCGYVQRRRKSEGDIWYDNWFKSQYGRRPIPVLMLFEIAWRCGPTEYITQAIIEMLRSEPVSPRIVGPFRFAGTFENLRKDGLKKLLQGLSETGHRETAIGILRSRLKAEPSELGEWLELAIDFVTSSEIIRSSEASYDWRELAKLLIPEYSDKIATAIFREQGTRGEKRWMLEFSEAAGVVKACVAHTPTGIWNALKPFLSDYSNARMFTIGFPDDLLGAIPSDEIMGWISEDPIKRAVILAEIVPKDFSSDETLLSRIIGSYGDNKEVDDHFYITLMCGSWHGDASLHWEKIADELSEVATRTGLRKLKRWARDSAKNFRLKAKRDRDTEAEDELRRR